MACSPTAMYEVIDSLDKKQKDEIASYNLGGLLQIPNVQIRRKACMQVAGSYSVEDDATTLR